ncbi:MAG TPA: FAD-dependent oxidoreductase [Candidatus Lustribacter sp.]|nr:FAD-dependent oxidoreductase [Candidatus Lustribacter sp.]
MAEYDVLVVGGGNAGCAAALAAARTGARTLLVERYGFLGGTATAAMVGPWMTFHSGNDRIVGGIAQEIVERLIALGGSPGHIPDSSGYVPTITPFDPEIHKALLFDLMRESNVHLLLHALVVDAVRDERGAVRGATFATVGGARTILAPRTIDATADAYVAAAAGVALQQGDERGRVQPASLMFRLSHVDMEAVAAYVRERPEQMRTSLKAHERTASALTAVAGLYELWAAAQSGGIDVPRELVSFFISPYPDEVTVNMTRVVDVDPLDPDDLTRAEIAARGQAMRLVAFFRERVPGFAHARIAATATQIGVRESRRIVGEYTLTRADILEARTFDDAIARSAYPIDIHNPSGSGTTTHRLPAGSSYEVPYRCLVPRAVDDLLVAGRCISTTHEALASTRLTPTVMTLGQAAGTAAALSLRAGVEPRALDAHVLREHLIAAGVDLRRPTLAGA